MSTYKQAIILVVAKHSAAAEFTLYGTAIYIYTYMCACVCVCVHNPGKSLQRTRGLHKNIVKGKVKIYRTPTNKKEIRYVDAERGVCFAAPRSHDSLAPVLDRSHARKKKMKRKKTEKTDSRLERLPARPTQVITRMFAHDDEFLISCGLRALSPLNLDGGIVVIAIKC